MIDIPKFWKRPSNDENAAERQKQEVVSAFDKILEDGFAEVNAKEADFNAKFKQLQEKLNTEDISDDEQKSFESDEYGLRMSALRVSTNIQILIEEHSDVFVQDRELTNREKAAESDLQNRQMQARQKVQAIMGLRERQKNIDTSKNVVRLPKRPA